MKHSHNTIPGPLPKTGDLFLGCDVAIRLLTPAQSEFGQGGMNLGIYEVIREGAFRGRFGQYEDFKGQVWTELIGTPRSFLLNCWIESCDLVRMPDI